MQKRARVTRSDPRCKMSAVAALRMDRCRDSPGEMQIGRGMQDVVVVPLAGLASPSLFSP